MTTNTARPHRLGPAAEVQVPREASDAVRAAYAAAFGDDVYRGARSREYAEGVLYALRCRLDGYRADCPYPSGTAAADAWHSGTREGHNRANELRADDAPMPGQLPLPTGR